MQGRERQDKVKEGTCSDKKKLSVILFFFYLKIPFFIKDNQYKWCNSHTVTRCIRDSLMHPKRLCCEIVTLIFDLDLGRRHRRGTKEKVLPQGIHIWNMKALSLTIQKLWPMLYFLCRQTEKQRGKNYKLPIYR